MMNFPPQQQPGPFPFLDELEQRVHPVTNYVLAGAFTVGGYFYGVEHESRFPVVLFAGLGLVLGLLAVALLKSFTTFLIYAAFVAAATLGTYWLLSNDAALRLQHKTAAAQTAPAGPQKPASFFDELLKSAQP